MMKVLLVEDEVGTRNLLRIIVNWEEFHMKIIGKPERQGGTVPYTGGNTGSGGYGY